VNKSKLENKTFLMLLMPEHIKLYQSAEGWH